MIRRLAATLAAFALLLILAVPVLAGGWAEIVADAQTTTEPPVEGQPIAVGFRVLQHGVTPAGWETATVHFTNASTGKTMDVVATERPSGRALRRDGHAARGGLLELAGDASRTSRATTCRSTLTVRTAAGDAAGLRPGDHDGHRAGEAGRARRARRALVRRDPAARAACSAPSMPGSTACSADGPDHRRARRARDAAWPRPREPAGCRSSPSSRWPSSPARTAGFAMAVAGRPAAARRVTVSPAPRGVDPA